MHRAGVVSGTTLDKITARDVDLAKMPRLKPPRDPAAKLLAIVQQKGIVALR